MPWRALRRSPGFTLAAVLLLAIGIGGATVIFSVTDAVLLRRLPIARPAELARVNEIIPGRPPSGQFEWDAYQDFQARTGSFPAVTAHFDFEVTRESGAEVRNMRADLVAPNYFDVLGVQPALGHLPAREDEVAISYRFWQSEFHGDPR